MLRSQPRPLAIVLVFGLATGGCDLATNGAVDVAEAGVDAAKDSATVDAYRPDATSDAGVDAEVDAAPIPDASPCDPTACPGKRCALGQCGYYATCNEAHLADSTFDTGTYKLFSAKKNAVFDGWCDMKTAGGGWLLVGASTLLGSSNSFGWKKSDGSLADDTKPYSLGVEALGLVPTEVLVGVRGLNKDLSVLGASYQMKAPPNLLSLKRTGGATSASTHVSGACGTTQAPNFTKFMGHVDQGDVFFFRDLAPSDNGYYYGLKPNGFDFVYDGLDCTNSGGLGPIVAVRQQGLLFIR